MGPNEGAERGVEGPRHPAMVAGDGRVRWDGEVFAHRMATWGYGRGTLNMANMKHNPAKRASPPADGERRAMIGYVPQYELAAWVVLRHLRERTLDFVRLADPQAERVDDFVIGSSELVSGYSVKWSQYRSSLSFNDLVKPRKNAPCWIAQLAEGHRALQAAYPNRRVTVHLVTSNIASSSDSCPGASGTNKTFAAFLHQAWLNTHVTSS